MFHKLSSRYGRKSSDLCIIFAYIHPFFSWILIALMAPFLANSACTNFVSHSFYIWSFTCWSWRSDNEISFDGKGTCCLNIAVMPLCNCNLTWKINYYWWNKYWQFCPIIANRQSFFFTNIHLVWYLHVTYVHLVTFNRYNVHTHVKFQP